MNIYDRLRARWEEAGIALSCPVPPRRLAAFERMHHVKLPADLRAYLATVGGMASGAMDDVSLSFHGFEEMFRPSETAVPFPPPTKAAVVADFLIDSHLYVTAVDPSGIAHPVLLVTQEADGWKGWKVAANFATFVESYLADAEGVAYPSAALSDATVRPLPGGRRGV